MTSRPTPRARFAGPDRPADRTPSPRRGAKPMLPMVALAGALSLLPLPAQAAPLGASLQGLLAHARAHSPDLGAMQREADAADQRIAPAGALPDPVLRIELMNFNNYGGNASPSLLPWKVGETRYTLMQSLPLGGKRELRRDVAAAGARQAAANAQAGWVELAAQIKTSYAEYYRVVGSERLTREVLGLMAQLEQVAQARYAVGLAAQSDAIRAQLEQTAMRAELLALEGQTRQLQARLNGLLGRDAAAPLAAPEALKPLPPLTPADAAALAERARQRNPQIEAERARLDMAMRGRELVQADRHPDLQVGISPSQMGSRITTWGVMVELNIPLQRESRRGQAREADAMIEAARARADGLSQQLAAGLAASLAALDAARRTQALSTTQLLPQSELALQSVLAAYESGKAEFALLLEAQRQIRKAKQEILRTQVEAQLHLAEIERLVGEEL